MSKNAENTGLTARLSYAGVAATARRLGCSREHLSKVLHGKRRANTKIARGLRRMGVEVA